MDENTRLVVVTAIAAFVTIAAAYIAARWTKTPKP